MPISSVAPLRPSFGMDQHSRDSLRRSRSPPSMRTTIREPPSAPSFLNHPSASKESWLSHMSPRFDDRTAPSSSDASSLRSDQTKHDCSSTFSGPMSSTTATSVSESDRLPPISAIDPALADMGVTSKDKQERRLSQESQKSQDHRSATRPNEPMYRLRLSPREGESSSVDWESPEDRGSPRFAQSRAADYDSDPRAYARHASGNNDSQSAAAALRSVPATGSSVARYSLFEDRPYTNRMEVELLRHRDERFVDDRYSDERRSGNRYRDFSPPPIRPLKRKGSFSEAAPPPSHRQGLHDGSFPGAREEEWGMRDNYYYDRAPPRPLDRGESPDRTPVTGALPYPPYDGYLSRYARDGPSRFLPWHRAVSPPLLPIAADYRNGGRPGYAGFDGPAAASYPDRRGGRYSPTISPSFAHRGGPAPPLAAEAGYYGGSRHRSPPFISDGRPFLPPPFPSRGSVPIAGLDRRHQASPSMETGCTPSPPHSEAFYPDRRFYYPRDRIEDPEVDEYYNEGPGRSRYASDGHYPTHESYDPPSNAFLPPPVSLGVPNGRHSNVPIPLVVPPPPPGHPSHHHRHEYGPPIDRPHAVLGIPPAHVPPGPSTGIAPPPRRRGKLPKPVTDLLRSWLLDHASHPYPTEDEKRSLCGMTGLTLQQVSNWFINARRRILLPGSNGAGAGATAEQVQAAFGDDDGSD